MSNPSSPYYKQGVPPSASDTFAQMIADVQAATDDAIARIDASGGAAQQSAEDAQASAAAAAGSASEAASSAQAAALSEGNVASSAEAAATSASNASNFAAAAADSASVAAGHANAAAISASNASASASSAETSAAAAYDNHQGSITSANSAAASASSAASSATDAANSASSAATSETNAAASASAAATSASNAATSETNAANSASAASTSATSAANSASSAASSATSASNAASTATAKASEASTSATNAANSASAAATSASEAAISATEAESYVSSIRRWFITRSMPPNAQDCIDIGRFSGGGSGSHGMRLVVAYQGTGAPSVKVYEIATKWAFTGGVWQRVPPLVATGPHGGHDFDLEVSQGHEGAQGAAALRLRRTGTGANATTAYITLDYTGGPSVSFTESSVVTSAAPEVSSELAGRQWASKSGDTITGSWTVQGTTTTNYLTVKAQGGSEGGEIALEKPPTGSSLAGNVVVDVEGNEFRVFENGTPYRGFKIDLTGCGSQAVLWHSDNFNPANYAPLSGAQFTNDIGTYRAGAPSTGAIYLNQDRSRYLLFNGSRYELPGSPLGVPYVAGGTGDAGFLKCWNSADAVCFRWLPGNHLAYRVNEAAESIVCTANNTKGLGYVSPGGGPLGINLNGYDLNGTLYGIHVDATSDERMKENIRPTQVDALDVLRQIEVVEFDWKPAVSDFMEQSFGTPIEDRHQRIGLIAQRLKDLVPEAINVLYQPETRHAAIPEDQHSINLQALVPYLIRAVQQQAETIENLTQRIEALESKTAS